MEMLTTALVLAQAAGAVVGAGGAIFAELSYFRVMKDGVIDSAERAHLVILARSLRWGMFVVLGSSVGLVIIAFASDAPIQPALTSAYWTLMTITLAVILSSWALSRRKVSFVIGSAVAFTGWWFITLLSFAQFPPMSFGASLALYIVAVAIIGVVLAYARMLTRKI